MNYGAEPADQVVRYSLEGAELLCVFPAPLRKTSLFSHRRCCMTAKGPTAKRTSSGC